MKLTADQLKVDPCFTTNVVENPYYLDMLDCRASSGYMPGDDWECERIGTKIECGVCIALEAKLRRIYQQIK